MKRKSPLALAMTASERRMGRYIFKVPVEEDLESDIGAISSLDPLCPELEGFILYKKMKE
jgi:hypothetical protein